MSKFRDIFLHSGKKYIVITIISIIVNFVIILYKGYNNFIAYCDATFVSGALCIGIGGLSVLGNYGAYDTLGYSIHYVRENTLRKDGSVKKYNDMHDYIEKQNLKRSKCKYLFVPYFVVGAFWIILSIILVSLV